MTFRKKILQEQGQRCFLVKGSLGEDGADVFCIVQVPDHKIQELTQRENGEAYDLTQYGKIVYCGFNHKIPEKTKQHLRETYGFDLP